MILIVPEDVLPALVRPGMYVGEQGDRSRRQWEADAVVALLNSRNEPHVQMDKPKIIHVNRQHIAMNAKDGGDRPVYTVKDNGKTRYASQIIIHGESRAVYNGEQLTCGARAWIETHGKLTLIGEMSFTEARAS